ncbi:MAG: hypothetical protein KJO91_03385, partial [Gammaproteobacteria bacterium]|nr:hypothetical protein [Gammaproteobacteria bacterium]
IGGAKVFTAYASQQVFNGEVILAFSTDGKILLTGKLNFAADLLSVTGRLYGDLSKIASGEATLLFLADIPDQFRLLTIEGRFKMGFRNPDTGAEATFTVIHPQTGKPYIQLDGPAEGIATGTGVLTSRGYMVVDIPESPDGATLNIDSVTDLSAEFKLTDGSGLILDDTKAPVMVDGEFWYWVKGETASSGMIDLIWLKETWSYTATDGTEVYAPGGAYQDADDAWQGEAESTQNVQLFMIPYIDVRLIASADGEIDDAAMQSFAAAGVTLLRKETSGDVEISLMTDSADEPQKTWISLGDGKLRLFLDPNDSDGITAGTYVLLVENTWEDSSGATSDEGKTYSFTLVDPEAQVSSPFTDNAPAIDVNVANKVIADDGGNAFIDIIYKATPGSSLDYASILDAGQEFSIAGIDFGGTPTPIAIVIDDIGIPSYEKQEQGSLTAEEWYTQLGDQGVTQFRYYADSLTEFSPDTITLNFNAFDAGNGEGWVDTGANGSKADSRTFHIEGPTPGLVSPAADGNIDIGALWGRGYIDVEWTMADGGRALDMTSITDLEQEFTLTGDGLGTIKLDAGQAPVFISSNGDDYTFRYWTTGEYADSGDVIIDFIAASWAFESDTSAADASITLTDTQWIEVDFDNVPEGYVIDPASVTDLSAEFTVTLDGVTDKTIELVTDVAPERVDETNTYRYRVSGDFLADGSQSVTLDFIDGSWSYTSETVAIDDNQTADASTLKSASLSYIDIALTPSVNVNDPTQPYTIDVIPLSGEITLSGNGINGPPVTANGTATNLGNGIYRYYVDASDFQLDTDGVVTVTVAAGAVEDSHGKANRETSQNFTVTGTAANITGPTDGGLIGMASQNNRGFLDITFGFPAEQQPDLDSFYDLDAEFSIDESDGHNIQLDETQAPVLIAQNSNTYTFRYFTLGSYTSGDVIITLTAESIGFTDGTTNTATDSMSVANPATVNIGYID